MSQRAVPEIVVETPSSEELSADPQQHFDRQLIELLVGEPLRRDAAAIEVVREECGGVRR